MLPYRNLSNWVLLGLAIIYSCSLWANGIEVKDVYLTGQNPNEQYTLISFDLSWQNSWRLSQGPANWDAAWVFAKFRVDDGPWQHASLHYLDGTGSNDGHSAPAEATITTPTDGRGVFIYRATDGNGDNDWPGIQLRWNYGTDGVANNDIVEVDVFAIEMVYVPKGAFTVGGGVGAELGKIYNPNGALQTLGYQIDSEGPIPVSSNGDALFYSAPPGEEVGDQLGPIPPAFPKGFTAFYCMKYELSQQQWIAFFNSLTPAQKANNDLTDLDHRGPNETDRNSIDWDGENGATTDHPFVPVTFINWSEALAYMDWAGLRPMSEFEYVKACRGPLAPVPNGYAWGTNNIIGSEHTYDLLEENSERELLENPVGSTGNANILTSSIFEDGPYRCGIFAASAVEARREDTGATYYGIMEMTGNVAEMAVTIGTPKGRSYRPNHGDGALTTAGEADVLFWPPGTGEGGGLFGGGWFDVVETLRLNDRRDAAIGNAGYWNDVGFRCVRSAP